MKKDTEKETAAKEAKEEKTQEWTAPEEKPEGKKEEKPAEETAEEKIVKLEKAVLELEDKRLRLIAEMDNLRKRTSKDMEQLRYSVMTDTLYPFFQVFDHFSMAVQATSVSNNLQSLLEGMKMIRNEFDRAFSELGVEKVDAVGKPFDPNTEEAVSQEASDTVPSGTVIRQWCFGYKSGNRLLKPASVVVSSGPAEESTKEKEV